jgi:hypothetical protein
MKLSCPLDGCHSNVALAGVHPIADGVLAVLMVALFVYVAVLFARGPQR